MSDEKLDKIMDSVARLEKAMIGDKEMGSIGLVQRMKEVERIQKQHGRIITYVTMAWTAIVALLLYFKQHIAESIVGKIH